MHYAAQRWFYVDIDLQARVGGISIAKYEEVDDVYYMEFIEMYGETLRECARQVTGARTPLWRGGFTFRDTCPVVNDSNTTGIITAMLTWKRVIIGHQDDIVNTKPQYIATTREHLYTAVEHMNEILPVLNLEAEGIMLDEEPTQGNAMIASGEEIGDQEEDMDGDNTRTNEEEKREENEDLN